MEALSRWVRTRSSSSPFKSRSDYDEALAVRLAAGGSQILCGHSGIPCSSDAVAVDLSQNLIAVSTSDGRVKVINFEGFEVTLLSDASQITPTRQLQFLSQRGAIARLAKGGELEVWGLLSVGDQLTSGRHPLATLKANGSPITCFVYVAGEELLITGHENGKIRFAHVAGPGARSPSDQPRPVSNLSWLPCVVSPEVVGTWSAVEQMTVQSYSTGEVMLVLLLHKDGVARVWDTRARRMVGCVDPSQKSQDTPQLSLVTAACWVGSRNSDFATGHQNGDIILWSLSEVGSVASSGDESKPPSPPPHCIALSRLHVNASGTARRAISSLDCVSQGRGEVLLVKGGQCTELPEGVTLVTLRVSGQGANKGVPAPTTLPWLGEALDLVMLTSSVSGGTVDQVIMLLEQGQLVLYDLKTEEPTHLQFHFHTQPPLTTTLVVNLVNQRKGLIEKFSYKSLLDTCRPSGDPGKDTKQQRDQDQKSNSRAQKVTKSQGFDWSSGQNAASLTLQSREMATVLLTGHKDGHVRAWDVNHESPVLLATIPSSFEALPVAAQVNKLQPVTSIEFDPEEGVLVVGHLGGDVQAYRHSTKLQKVTCAFIDRELYPENTFLMRTQQISCAAGFQLILSQQQVHNRDITMSSYLPASEPLLSSSLRPTRFNPSTKLLLVGDAEGHVSLTDLTTGRLVFHQQPLSSAVAGIHLVACPLPPARYQSDELKAVIPTWGGRDGGTHMNGSPAPATPLPARVSEDSSQGDTLTHTRPLEISPASPEEGGSAGPPVSRTNSTSSVSSWTSASPGGSTTLWGGTTSSHCTMMGVVVLGRDGTMGLLDAEQGNYVGRWGLAQPRWGLLPGPRALHVMPLDADGNPLRNWRRSEQTHNGALPGLQDLLAQYVLLATEEGLSIISVEAIVSGSLTAVKSVKFTGRAIFVQTFEVYGVINSHPAVLVLQEHHPRNQGARQGPAPTPANGQATPKPTTSPSLKLELTVYSLPGLVPVHSLLLDQAVGWDCSQVVCHHNFSDVPEAANTIRLGLTHSLADAADPSWWWQRAAMSCSKTGEAALIMPGDGLLLLSVGGARADQVYDPQAYSRVVYDFDTARLYYEEERKRAGGRKVCRRKLKGLSGGQDQKGPGWYEDFCVVDKCQDVNVGDYYNGVSPPSVSEVVGRPFPIVVPRGPDAGPGE